MLNGCKVSYVTETFSSAYSSEAAFFVPGFLTARAMLTQTQEMYQLDYGIL